MSVSRLDLGELRLEGRSRAGDSSWIRVSPPGLAFDVGRGSARLTGARDLFVSHGHLDHALGVPFVLSNRSLHLGEPTRVACPAAIADSLDRLIRAAEILEGERYRYEIVPMVPGDRLDVGKGFLVEAFPVDHVVPSLGFHLLRRKRRLRADLRGLPEPEIVALRREGREVGEEVEELALSYTGDTSAGVFDLEPRLFDSPRLVLECTFLGEELRDKGAQYGHLHFQDLVERAHRFRNRILVLTHLSRRHRPGELRERIDAELPGLASRIRIFDEEGRSRPRPLAREASS